MYAIEFETDIQDGVVKIPEEYTQLKNQHVRVLVMVDEATLPPLVAEPLDLSEGEIQAFKGRDAVELQREMRDEW